MKPISFLIVLFIILGCKQKSSVKTLNTEESKLDVKDAPQISPTIKELATFTEVPITKGINPNQHFIVKKIDKEGKVTPSDLKSGITLYKQVLSDQSENRPIFEIANSNNVILLTKSKGYMGAIWAKILVNKATLEIQKVQFDHKGESEGYGADFTLSSFENKFTGTKISFTSNTFGLTQSDKVIIDGDKDIDGISGATITSEAAVKMMNNGLVLYRNYLY